MSFGDLKVQDLIYEDSSNNEITVVIADLATKNNPTFTGTVTVPTAPASDVSTKAASTQFVDNYYATKASPTFTGSPTVPGYAALAGAAFTGAVTGTNLTLSGNLVVNGTTTTINTQTLDVEDINITLGKVSTPSDTTANNGGITLKGASDKTFNWLNATDAWTSSEHLHLLDDKNLILGTSSHSTLSYVSGSSTTKLINRNTSVEVIDNGTVAGSIHLKVDGGNQFFINDRGFVAPILGTVGYQWVPTLNQDVVLGVRGRGSATNNLAVVDLTSSQGSVSGADVKYGKIRFSWDNTANVHDNGTAMIEGCSGAASSGADRATALKFYTAPTGSAGSYAALPVERLRIWKDGQIGIGGANYGTSGQALVSGGSGAAPSWADVGGSPEIEATATGAIAIQEACIVRSDGTIEKVDGSSETVGSDSEFHISTVIPVRVVYNPDKNNNVIFYLKASGTTQNDGRFFCRSVDISGTTITYGTQRAIPTKDSSNNEVSGYVNQQLADACYDTQNDRFMIAYVNKGWGRLNTAAGYANSAGNDFTFGDGGRYHSSETQGTKYIRCVFNPDVNKVAVVWTNTNNYLHVAQGEYASDDAAWNFTTTPQQVTTNTSSFSDITYDSNNQRYIHTWKDRSVQGYSVTYRGSGADDMSSFYSFAAGSVEDNAVVYVPGAQKFIVVYRSGSNSSKPEAKLGELTGSGNKNPSYGSAFELSQSSCTYLTAVLDPTNNKVIASWNDSSQGKRYARVCTISGSTMTWTPQFEIIVGAGQTQLGWNTHQGKAVVAARNGVTTEAGKAGIYIPGNTNATTENFIGFAKAAIGNGATGSVKIVGNTATKSSMTPGQKYYIQNDGSIGLTPVEGNVIEAGIALSSTKLLIKG